jgi:aminoacrylate hydrolase
MRYDIFGNVDPDAATIVFSAGLGGLGGFWRPQFEALGQRFRVITYDHRGTGKNAESLSDGYAIADMADDVVEILDNAGVACCHFIGHALGGLVGLDLAIRAPSRLASLVLVNAWSTVDTHTLRCFEVRKALLDHVGPEAYVHAQPIFLYPAAWLSQQQATIVREEEHSNANFQGVDNLTRRLEALLAFDAGGSLGEIRTPTLVIAARDDVLVPYTCSQTLARGIQHARLWLTPEGGHACSVSDPGPFNETLLDFLTGVDLAAAGVPARVL